MKVSNEYLEKLRSIAVMPVNPAGSTRKWTHDGDRSGSFQTEHWDGSEDVTIKAGGIKVTREDVLNARQDR